MVITDPKNTLRRVPVQSCFPFILKGTVSDPDPHGSVLIWLSWIRIRIGNADPDPGARKLKKINK